MDIGRGECWSCPANWHRTVNPVNSPNACSSDLGGVFAVDPGAMCAQVVGALSAGQAAGTRLMATIKPLIEPLMKPIDDGVRALSARISTPAELTTLTERLGTPAPVPRPDERARATLDADAVDCQSSAAVDARPEGRLRRRRVSTPGTTLGAWAAPESSTARPGCARVDATGAVRESPECARP